MFAQLKDLVLNKKVLILGFGREGQSTYKALMSVSAHAELAIADKNPTSVKIDDKVAFFSGEDYLNCLNDFDIVFKSPGIALPISHSEYKCKITSQTEVFLSAYAKQTVGITGTKGKSTTSSLIYHILKECGKDCLLVGNIGFPAFDRAEQVNDETIIVYELSCHQLHELGVSPAIAIFLNIFEDHLDRYKTIENYANAKSNIFMHQTEENHLFCLEQFKNYTVGCKSNVHYVTRDILPFDSFNDLPGVTLRGEHNLINAAFALSVCSLFGISEEQFCKAIANFSTLPHRLEFIGTKNGIAYYDDSISTTAESAMSAIKSIENAETVLIGGMDRGIDYSGLIDFLVTCKLKTVILMYASGKRILSELGDRIENATADFKYVPDLAEAVKLAKSVTSQGKACVLSPAAASYDSFKNFEERGDKFKELAFKV